MHILNFKNVSYQNDNNYILKDTNFDVNKGDLITITGPSGSGKSTLLRLSNNLISPTSGEILFNCKNIMDYDVLELRRNISLCFQMPYLFGNTVIENLEFPFSIRKVNIDKKIIIERLNMLNIDESYLDKDIRNLSGGEKQRISLARTLIFKPQILLLDEVTSALDEENTLNVENIVKNLNNEGITILWVTHNLLQEKRLESRQIRVEQGILQEVKI